MDPATWSEHDLQELTSIRDEIDALDSELLALFHTRIRLVGRVGHLKARNGEVVATRAGREISLLRSVIARNRALGDGRFPDRGILAIWNEIIAASTQLEHRFSVATDGSTEAGDWARKKFGWTTPITKTSRALDAVQQLDRRNVDFAVLRIDSKSGEWLSLLNHNDKLSILFHVPFCLGTDKNVHNSDSLAEPFTPRDLLNGKTALVLGWATPSPSGAEDWSYILASDATGDPAWEENQASNLGNSTDIVSLALDKSDGLCLFAGNLPPNEEAWQPYLGELGYRRFRMVGIATSPIVG